MISKMNDRTTQRYPKDAAVTASLQKKGNVSIPTSRMKSDRLYKPKQESFLTPASRFQNKNHHNCFPPTETPRTSKRAPAPLKVKSVSLVYLPSDDKHQPNIRTQRKTVSREQRDVLVHSNEFENTINNNIFSLTSTRECKRAKYVCRQFIVHAWRKRRAQNNSLQLEIKILNKEVENLIIQKHVLKDLLESQNKRVTISMQELNLTRNQLEEGQKTNKELDERLISRDLIFSKEKIHWQSTKIENEKRIESLKTEVGLAVKNILDLTEKAEYNKQQLDNSRKKIVSLKGKLEASESSLKDKMNDFNTLQNKCLDLQTTVKALVSRNQEVVREKEGRETQIREYIKNIKNVEVELNNFQNIKQVQRLDLVKLKNSYEDIKDKINSKDLEIGFLQETIKQYEREKKQLKGILKTTVLRVFQVSLKLIPLPNYITI